MAEVPELAEPVAAAAADAAAAACGQPPVSAAPAASDPNGSAPLMETGGGGTADAPAPSAQAPALAAAAPQGPPAAALPAAGGAPAGTGAGDTAPAALATDASPQPRESEASPAAAAAAAAAPAALPGEPVAAGSALAAVEVGAATGDALVAGAPSGEAESARAQPNDPEPANRQAGDEPSNDDAVPVEEANDPDPPGATPFPGRGRPEAEACEEAGDLMALEPDRGSAAAGGDPGVVDEDLEVDDVSLGSPAEAAEGPDLERRVPLEAGPGDLFDYAPEEEAVEEEEALAWYRDGQRRPPREPEPPAEAASEAAEVAAKLERLQSMLEAAELRDAVEEREEDEALEVRMAMQIEELAEQHAQLLALVGEQEGLEERDKSALHFVTEVLEKEVSEGHDPPPVAAAEGAPDVVEEPLVADVGEGGDAPLAGALAEAVESADAEGAPGADVEPGSEGDLLPAEAEGSAELGAEAEAEAAANGVAAEADTVELIDDSDEEAHGVAGGPGAAAGALEPSDAGAEQAEGAADSEPAWAPPASGNSNEEQLRRHYLALLELAAEQRRSLALTLEEIKGVEAELGFAQEAASEVVVNLSMAKHGGRTVACAVDSRAAKRPRLAHGF